MADHHITDPEEFHAQAECVRHSVSMQMQMMCQMMNAERVAAALESGEPGAFIDGGPVAQGALLAVLEFISSGAPTTGEDLRTYVVALVDQFVPQVVAQRMWDQAEAAHGEGTA